MVNSIRTPAKLNLGLEVVGRRRDGFHDISTIFQTVSIYDELEHIGTSEFRYISGAGIEPEQDLARPVFERAARRFGWHGTLHSTKGIPVAAGLGGGSSDTALALRLEATAAGNEADVRGAGRFGADVPFLLYGGTALGEGIGDQLEALPLPDLWFVVHVPRIHIPEKTRTLFNGLVPSDLTDGSFISDIARRLASAQALPDILPNAFQRQMTEFGPVADAWRMLDGLAGRVALSGAGPAIYSWHSSQGEADEVFQAAQSALPGTTRLCRSVQAHQDGEDLKCLVRKLSKPTDGTN